MGLPFRPPIRMKPEPDLASMLRRALLLAPLGWLAQAVPAQPRAPGEVLIGGTGAGIGPVSRLLDGAGRLRYVPLGTSGGLKAVAAGAIDIALSARALNDAEKAQGLIEHELFRTPLVWATHAGVPLSGVSLAQLVTLYGGAAPSWSHGAPVRVVLRPESDSDTKFLKALSPAMAEAVAQAQARPGAFVAATDGDASEALERIAGSLGLSTLGLLRAESRKVQVLALDGVRPDVDTLVSRRYPFSKTVFAVTRGQPVGEPAAHLASLLARAAAPRLAVLGCVSAAGA